jgi:hypothetical protein
MIMKMVIMIINNKNNCDYYIKIILAWWYNACNIKSFN